MNTPGYSDRYVAEIEIAALKAAARLKEAGITNLALDGAGLDTQPDNIREISQGVFAERLDQGYELSYSQLCDAFHLAGQLIASKDDQPK